MTTENTRASQHRTGKNPSDVCLSLCTTVVHNTAQNSFADLPSNPYGR